jgi:hypothetical protein
MESQAADDQRAAGGVGRDEGAAHGWPDWVKDLAAFSDWFDKHLAKK